MQKTIHRSESRGLTATGWLVSRHTFSFGDYYDPQRMNFGLLRVVNQDLVLQGKGFDAHHHDNMEIVSIPYKGSLRHKDSTGNEMVIQTGDIQIMSAGTGVDHSEFNDSDEDTVEFLQIWIYPKKMNISPRYEQKSFDVKAHKNNFLAIVAPEKNGESLWINQDAWFLLGFFEGDKAINYTLHKDTHGVYIFVLEGNIQVAGEKLKRGDGIGISEIPSINIQPEANTKILLIEVPMQ